MLTLARMMVGYASDTAGNSFLSCRQFFYKCLVKMYFGEMWVATSMPCAPGPAHLLIGVSWPYWVGTTSISAAGKVL
jgi:hypothetical protein